AQAAAPPPTATNPPTAVIASATPLPPSPTVAPSATPVPPTPTPDPQPLVGIQVGHWKIEDHPDEQARLRRFSGAYYGGYDEWEINIVIAELLRDRLEAAGVRVELLPATVPIGYRADAFISIHADGVDQSIAGIRRGWKVATPFRSSLAGEQLAAAISETYPSATGLPYDPRGISYDMRAYYAFAHYRYRHAIDPGTPAVLVECGFMTNPIDRELLFNQPDLIAAGIAEGVLNYLAARDPADAAATEPRGRPMQRPLGADIPLLADAAANARVLRTLDPNDRLVPMAESQGWLLVFTHGGDWDLGWVRVDQVEPTDDPLVPPET
ncbi:MAG: N-acetylmuramoyl-L-alanine amidase, partial [Oscillochloris sp.]|nr:N-acetylmuramoyl-L-alanine amidase [Oscillochloris sp.]